MLEYELKRRPTIPHLTPTAASERSSVGLLARVFARTSRGIHVEKLFGEKQILFS
jgi:hypothetical protein